jgi:hypothetical protein
MLCLTPTPRHRRIERVNCLASAGLTPAAGHCNTTRLRQRPVRAAPCGWEVHRGPGLAGDTRMRGKSFASVTIQNDRNDNSGRMASFFLSPSLAALAQQGSIKSTFSPKWGYGKFPHGMPGNTFPKHPRIKACPRKIRRPPVTSKKMSNTFREMDNGLWYLAPLASAHTKYRLMTDTPLFLKA